MDLPKFVTFDCYGTLIDFRIGEVLLSILGPRAEKLTNVNQFLQESSDIRFNEILGDYKPYRDVLRDSTRKAFTKYGLEYREQDGEALVAAVPTWGHIQKSRRLLSACESTARS